jgi:hypothetical protein
MICYVIFDNNEINLNSPDCISKSSVYELIVNRWAAEQNRIEAKKT